MSGVFPITDPDGYSLRSISPTRVSVAHNTQKRIVRSTLSHRWHVRLAFNNRSESQYSQIEGFMDAQHGRAEAFTVVLPNTPQGSWLGSPVVNGASQTGYTLNLSGFTANQTGVIKSGDIFKTANIAKVYRATADANSDGTGLCTVTLNCQLVESPVNGSAITYNNVPLTVASTSDDVETIYSANMIGSMSIELIEAP